jgi:hypothetical protein
VNRAYCHFASIFVPFCVAESDSPSTPTQITCLCYLLFKPLLRKIYTKQTKLTKVFPAPPVPKIFTSVMFSTAGFWLIGG